MSRVRKEYKDLVKNITVWADLAANFRPVAPETRFCKTNIMWILRENDLNQPQPRNMKCIIEIKTIIN